MAVKVRIMGAWLPGADEEFLFFEKRKYEDAGQVSSDVTLHGNFLVKAHGPELPDALKVLRAPTSRNGADEYFWNVPDFEQASSIFLVLMHYELTSVCIFEFEFA